MNINALHIWRDNCHCRSLSAFLGSYSKTERIMNKNNNDVNGFWDKYREAPEVRYKT